MPWVNPTTNDLTGVPPTFAFAARYVNSGFGGIGFAVDLRYIWSTRAQRLYGALR